MRRTITALAVAGLVMVPASALAECAWVLWSRFSSGSHDEVLGAWTNLGEWTSPGFANVYPTHAACQAKVTALTHIPEPSSLGDWLDWMRSRGQYHPRQRTMDLFHMKPDEVYISRDDSAAVVILPTRGTTWRCLPATVDPRGAKAK